MVAVLVLDVIHRRGRCISGRSNGSKCHNGKSNRSSCKIEKCTLAFTPNERHSAYGGNVFWIESNNRVQANHSDGTYQNISLRLG